MIGFAFDLDEQDDIEFVHRVRSIVAGVLRVVEPAEAYVVKIDSWFGEKWLGFSNKLLGELAVWHRKSLRVPPFVPSRVTSQRCLRRAAMHEYVEREAASRLHVEQTSGDNARRLISVLCPDAAVFWWSGETIRNRRGCLMAYLPTPDHHIGWYAEFRNAGGWRLGKTQCTTAQELSAYAAHSS